MADPSEQLKQYYANQIAQKQLQEERDSKEYIKRLETKSNVKRAQLQADADRYKSNMEFNKTMLELQGKNDIEKLGSWVNLLTQLNKYDEQNPLSQYATDETKKYEGTDTPIRYYMKDGESTGEPIPLSLAIRANKRDRDIKETRQLLLDGVKSVNMFGQVINTESKDKGRFTFSKGEFNVDGKPLSKIQRDLDGNPTVDLPDENDRTMTQSQLKARKNTMTVSDMIALQREKGDKGQGTKKDSVGEVGSSSGGFNAGSSPNQFLGKVSDFFSRGNNPDPRPAGRGAYFQPEGVESVKNFFNRDPIAPIPTSKRKK